MTNEDAAKLKWLASQLSGLLKKTGHEDMANSVLNAVSQAIPHDEYVKHLKQEPLKDALWWFIENIESDYPRRSELFFLLRERMRSE